MSDSSRHYGRKGSSIHGFSRQEYWGGLPFPSSGNLPDPAIKPTPPASPALAGEFANTTAAWGPGLEGLREQLGWQVACSSPSPGVAHTVLTQRDGNCQLSDWTSACQRPAPLWGGSGLLLQSSLCSWQSWCPRRMLKRYPAGMQGPHHGYPWLQGHIQVQRPPLRGPPLYYLVGKVYWSQGHRGRGHSRAAGRSGTRGDPRAGVGLWAVQAARLGSCLGTFRPWGTG